MATGEERRSLPTYIAWVSTCLLAAAAGPMLNGEIRNLWMQIGCFGLAAALGLEASARFRRLGQEHRNRQAVQRRYERELSYLTTDRLVSEELVAAVTHILAVSKVPAKRYTPRRVSQRFRCNLNVEVVGLKAVNPKPVCSAKAPFTAQLRDVSSNGFSMSHEHSLKTPYALLNIALPDGKQTVLLAEIMWCRRTKKGYYRSGGRLVRVLKDKHWPARKEPQGSPAASPEAPSEAATASTAESADASRQSTSAAAESAV